MDEGLCVLLGMVLGGLIAMGGVWVGRLWELPSDTAPEEPPRRVSVRCAVCDYVFPYDLKPGVKKAWPTCPACFRVMTIEPKPPVPAEER